MGFMLYMPYTVEETVYQISRTIIWVGITLSCLNI
jgi:hypothetical protein